MSVPGFSLCCPRPLPPGCVVRGPRLAGERNRRQPAVPTCWRLRGGGGCRCSSGSRALRIPGPNQLACCLLSPGRVKAPDDSPRVSHKPLPSDLSAPVNGEATSQKGESPEDKEQEEGQNSEEGPGGGSSEDPLHNDSAREGPDLDGPGKERVRMDSESLDDEDS